MTARKKKNDEEKTEGQETQEGKSYTERAMQRLEESGDTRVPSDPEHFRPADIPPEPLTPTESSSNA